MSKAFRCDRCGKCFAPLSKTEFVRMKEIVFGDSEHYSKRFESVDFCYDCSHEFKQWMSMNKRTVDGDPLL